MSMRGFSKDIIFLLLAAALIFGAVRLLSGGGSGGEVAPTPAVFSERLSYSDARERARDSSRLVMVFATADWCGPCQSLKRGALSDPRVETLIQENLEPVYLDVDERENQDLARRLGVSGIPATYIVRDDEVIAKSTGALPADSYYTWLKGAVGR